MTTINFMLMDSPTAQSFRDRTADADDRLDPRLVDAGEHAGEYALNARLRTVEEFRAFWPEFAALPVADLDLDVAWPPEPSDEEPDEE